MVTIKAPELYLDEPDILRQAGTYISVYGRRIFVIGGRTGLEKAGKPFLESLSQAGCVYETRILPGYPTYEEVKHLVEESYGFHADVIVGVGGGKVCDVAKAVGNIRNLPIVEVPTIAATCACWAARSILYQEDGDFDFIQWNPHNPRLILADTRILMQAPRRYLASGILDSLAKWYEFEPLIASEPFNLVLRQDVAVAKLLFDVLKCYGYGAMEDRLTVEEQKQVLDSILYLTGVTGSFASGKAFRGFAHCLYYASTRFPATRFLLHGEKVAYGLLVQFLLEGREEEQIREHLKDLVFYGVDRTIEEWGIHTPQELAALAETIIRESPVVIERGFVRNGEEIIAAVTEADRLLKEYRLEGETYGRA